ncbi:MAG TPA: pyocin knob domain-containing protein, partial [Tenuifilaceae bacterium]|nr:pyocin knob domain-containing protein [Tenuifilaceae bacterium]
GIPSNILGEDGQYYRNTANQNIHYKQAGTWALVGNLTGVAFTPVLAQAGIGRYLGNAPNLVTTGSMNDLVIAGEYYVTGSVTNMPPNVGAGYVKVWGLDSSNVAQIMQRTSGLSLTEMHFRQSSGGVFGAWRSLANLGGSDTQRFKVANGFYKDEAVSKGQLDAVVNTVLGHNQDWYDMEYARSLGTTYTNTSNKPIVVSVGFTMTGSPSGFQYAWWDFKVQEMTVARAHMAFDSGGIVSRDGNISVIVPPQQTYSLNRSGAAESIIDYWTELRGVI